MKKLLLSGLVVLTASLSLNAQVVAIPDANFKAILIGDASINTNMDTEIQISEAVAYTGAIYCSSSAITDLTGIEAFVAITSLYCDDNQLSSLNLSANVNLTEVVCNYNKITSLNVSGNLLLTYLEAHSNVLTSFISVNALETVNLSYNPNLGNVDFNGMGNSLLDVQLSSCGMTALSLSNHPGLIFLTCDDNSISSLDLSSNTSLRTLNCATNVITNLDVNGLTQMYELDFNNNAMTAVDLSTCTGLKKLIGHEGSLTSIDLTNNTILEEVFLYENNIVTFDLPISSTLFKLSIDNNDIVNFDASMLPGLKLLVIRNNALTSLNVANGTNTIVTTFLISNNPNLTCVQVDDVAYSTTNWFDIDPTASYSLSCASTASVNETEVVEFTMFPNPVSDVLNVVSSENIELVEIYDTYGKIVDSFNTSSFSVKHLNTGIYYITVTTQNGVAKGKFVKE